MAWDFSTEPEFQEKLDWARRFLDEEILPLETIQWEVSEDDWRKLTDPLREEVKRQGLWACHLDPELGGQGYGQVKLALLHEILGRSPVAPPIFGNAAPDSGNAELLAIGGNDEQKAKWLQPLLDGKLRSAFSMTEPEVAGSDPTLLRTTAVLDGDEYVINGEKIFVTAGERADCVVVWATLDRNLGRAAIKSFVVEKGTPGMELIRLDHKMGIRASDTAVLSFNDCRIPKTNILGSPEIDTKKSFAGVMQTFDNTRPMVAAMAVGVGKAALDRVREILREEGIDVRYDQGILNGSAIEAELRRLEAELEAARLLTIKAAWMADNKIPNSMEASMAKAKAGRVATEITLRCVELAGALGYQEDDLLEKWARDSKILDIFEGTQQIQLLIIARRMLGLTSAQLR